MSKVLVSYFSASGVTKRVAEKVATAINGDLFEIEPVDKYTNADLDWTNKQSRSTIEMRDKTFRPPIKSRVQNINDYDLVILGFPVWWYTAPTIINTFIEENDLVGKDIYVFVTSGSSSIDSTYRSLQSNFPNLSFVSGKRFTGSESEEEYKSWIA